MSADALNWEENIEKVIQSLYRKRSNMFAGKLNTPNFETTVMQEEYDKMRASEEKIQKAKAIQDHRDITGSITGLRYNEGKLPWHLVDFRALKSMVEVLEYGAKKYAEDQWKKGLSLKEIRDSFLRHVIEWNSGQEVDSESGKDHIGHMMCNLLFYEYFTKVDPSKARD